jgi:hypothetical protein
MSRTSIGPSKPPFQWLISEPFLDVKRPRREADHTARSREEVKNVWKCTYIPLHTPSWSGSSLITGLNLPSHFTYYANAMTIKHILQYVQTTIITIGDFLVVSFVQWQMSVLCCILSFLTLAGFNIVMGEIRRECNRILWSVVARATNG